MTRQAARWQHGQCGTYARALIMMRPELRLGALGQPWADDDDGVMAEHYFAHDGRYAYDSLGRHELPYQHPDPYYRDYGQELDTIDHGVAEEEWDTEEELDAALASAMRHIRRHRILGEEEAGH